MEQYGALELKKNYQKYLKIGLIVAIFIHFFTISTYFLAFSNSENLIEKKFITQVVDITNIEIPPSINEEEIVKEIENISSIKDLTALTPQPVARELAEELTIKTQTELENINVPVGNDTGKFQYTGNENLRIEEEKKIIDKIEKKVEEEKVNYKSFEVEKVPECVNLNQVRGLMKYPELAIEAQIEGRVTIKVLVGLDGSIEKIGNISGPEIFYSEVKEKSKLLKFTPGLQNGKAVNVWISVPFIFKLN